MANIFNYMPEIQGEEMMFLQNLTKNYTDEQLNSFVQIYRARRKDPQTILLLTILGLFCLAGVHRFVLNQIGMGLLYFFTGGLCLIGTIVDIFNYNNLTFGYNRQVAIEVDLMIARQ